MSPTSTSSDSNPLASLKHDLRCSMGFSVAPSRLTTQSPLVFDMETWGFSYIECPLLHPSFDWRSSLNDLESTEKPLIKSNLFVQSSEFARCTVATVPQFLDSIEPGDDEKAFAAFLRLKQYVSWVSHLGLSTLQLQLPEDAAWVPEFAHQLLAILPLLMGTVLWVRVDLDQTQAWENWTLLQTLLGPQPPRRCHAALVLPTCDPALLARWMAEPVACVRLAVSCFETSAKGFPMLPKHFRPECQTWLARLPYLTLHLDTEMHAEGPPVYRQYLAYLYRTRPITPMDTFTAECRDLLQAPLQPLMHQLDMNTYDTFERDRVKYEQYQAAIAKALLAKRHLPKVTVLMVGMGARGPLVDCCARASDQVQVPVFIYALEKNPNALVTLAQKQKAVWGDELVEVVFADMRSWKPPVLCDLMVSELLGSFGDNELSPECLDGAQVALKDDAISIPQSYSAYLAPLSSCALYHNALEVKDPAPLEMGYVVKFYDAELLGQAQEVWSFHHPLPPQSLLSGNKHNYRHAALEFEMKKEAIVHGFAAYFDSVLFGDVTLSTVPETHTENMLSWFPMYYPIKHPMHVLQGDKLKVHFWRCTNDKRAWYEWTPLLMRQGKYITTPSSNVHNSNGMSQWIGL